MTKTITTMAINLAHAAGMKEPTKIGGGIFSADECREAALALAASSMMLAALRNMVPLALEAIEARSASDDWEDAEMIDVYRRDIRSAQAAIAAAEGTPSALPSDPDTWPGGDLTGHPDYKAEGEG